MRPAGSPLRVAVLCEFGTVNGGERSLLAALESLHTQVEPVFFAPVEGRLAVELERRGWTHRPWNVRDAEGRRRNSSHILTELEQSLTRLSPELVHANSLAMGRLTGQLARTSEFRCTAHLRDIIGLSPAAVADLNENRALFAVSTATRQFHTKQGIDAERVHVLYNGVDLRRFAPASSTEVRVAVRRQWQLPEDALLAVTVGQIGVRKGLDVLAAAIPEFAARFPSLHFLWIGERYSAKAEAVAFEAGLHRQLNDAGAGSRVHWLGYSEAIPEMLAAADLLIHPARQEPLGRVLLEAAACGLPIVATAVGGTPEILVDGESGWLVAPDDAHGLARAVTHLLADEPLRRQFGAAARRRMEERFDVDDRARDLLAAWMSVVGR